MGIGEKHTSKGGCVLAPHTVQRVLSELQPSDGAETGDVQWAVGIGEKHTSKGGSVLAPHTVQRVLSELQPSDGAEIGDVQWALEKKKPSTSRCILVPLTQCKKLDLESNSLTELRRDLLSQTDLFTFIH